MATGPLKDLAGKVVIITGSSSGIGAAAAEYFASLGSSVVITGRSKEGLQNTAALCTGTGLPESEVLSVSGDLTNEKHLESLVARTIEKFGKLIVLVNNAGAMDAGGILDNGIEQYDRMFNINLRSVVLLTRLCIPHLLATKGSIVNVSSVGGLRAATMASYYGMAKAGMDHFTRCLGLELADKGVRVNAVNPALVHTNLGRDLQQIPGREQLLKAFAEAHPIGRGGQPIEIAKTIAFLASEDSSFTTCQNFVLDGGLTVTTRLPDMKRNL